MEKLNVENEVFAIACDQAAYDLKLQVMAHLDERGIKYIDYGTDSTASVDYPDFAHKACEAIQNGTCTRGILICGTGVGMSMAANKHKGIRAACVGDTFSTRMTRMHNDANVICFGARVIGLGLALDIVDLFIDTPFEGGRHARRVDKVMSFENA